MPAQTWRFRPAIAGSVRSIAFVGFLVVGFPMICIAGTESGSSAVGARAAAGFWPGCSWWLDLIPDGRLAGGVGLRCITEEEPGRRRMLQAAAAGDGGELGAVAPLPQLEVAGEKQEQASSGRSQVELEPPMGIEEPAHKLPEVEPA